MWIGFEGLGFGKIFGGKDWFRVGVYVLVRLMGLVMEIRFNGE